MTKGVSPGTKCESTSIFTPASVAIRPTSSTGVWLASNRLRPTSEATTVRNRDGKKSVLNGPFAETKEQLAGFYLMEAPDLDGALAWAARCPGATHGSIEVRPTWKE